MRLLRVLLLVTALFSILGTLENSHACPACKLIDKTAPKDLQRAGEGFSLSVIFLLVVPMGLTTGLVAYIVKTIKQLDAEK
jgi:hypothetical protein